MGIKDKILYAGLTLLREKGVSALTQPQIAQAANIKQSHLTYYFSTRADLLLAIAKFTLSTLMDNVTAQVRDVPQSKTLADAIFRIMIDGLPPRVILGLIVAADSDPDIRKSLRKLIRHVRRTIKSLLEQAGMACDDGAAMLFHATIIGLAVMHQARLNKESAREAKDGIAILMRILAPDTPKHMNRLPS